MLNSLNWESLRSLREDLSMGLFKRFTLPFNLNLVSDIFKPNANASGMHVHSNPLNKFVLERMLILLVLFLEFFKTIK